MAHINNIGASIYTTLTMNAGSVAGGKYPGIPSRPADLAGFRAQFETPSGSDVENDPPTVDADAVDIGFLRELPPVGSPPNVVNVPQFGQATTSQIKAQSDAPSLELTVNYVPSYHGFLDQIRKDGVAACFRIRLTNADAVTGTANELFDDIYFYGTIASMEVTPSLSDSMQATIALTIDGDFEGPASEMGTGASSDYDLPPVV